MRRRGGHTARHTFVKRKFAGVHTKVARNLQEVIECDESKIGEQDRFVVTNVAGE